jgi:hypothetical protein
MDENQVIDLMMSRNYFLYARPTEEVNTRLIFTHAIHPSLTAQVRWNQNGHVDMRLRSLTGLIVVQTIWFSIDHPKFRDLYEAKMERILRAIGTWNENCGS